MQPCSADQEILINTFLKMDVLRIAGDHPFFYTSGWASPVYVDLRQLLSDVVLRNEILRIATALATQLKLAQEIDAIVGSEGSGTVFAAWLADRLQLPMLYLRKRPMGWGDRAQLEGDLPPKAKLLFVDDVTTDGRSKIDVCLTLKKMGAVSCDALVLVNFDIYPQSQQLQLVHGIALHSLLTWPALCQAFMRANRFNAQERQTIQAFNDSPILWSLQHGGIGT